MTAFDYAVLVIVGSSVVISVMRGFAREVLALAGWVIAFFAATALSGPVSSAFTVVSDPSLRVLAAFVAVFVVTLIAASLVGMVIARLLKSAGLGVEDRLLGGFFGLARGMLIVLVIVLLAGLTALPRQPAWTNAMLSPPLEALAGTIKPWLPQVVSGHLSYD
jgi:membrane protein required for colicin V production